MLESHNQSTLARRIFRDRNTIRSQLQNGVLKPLSVTKHDYGASYVFDSDELDNLREQSIAALRRQIEKLHLEEQERILTEMHALRELKNQKLTSKD